MSIFNHEKEDYIPSSNTEPKKKTSTFKIFIGTVGALVAVSHLGLLGYLIDRKPEPPTAPTINLPRGPYSSYKIKAGKDGYEIEYRANDPKILESESSLDLDKEKRGFFGGCSEKRTEYRRDQFTMDGTRNMGGVNKSEGKSAKEGEGLIADAGARSQGAMAGTAIASGVAAPALVSIPYVGWLAGGWALLLGQQVGETIGSEVGSVFNDC